MLQLWHGDARILQVTLRMLLGMRGGTGDYDDPGPPLPPPADQPARAYSLARKSVPCGRDMLYKEHRNIP